MAHWSEVAVTKKGEAMLNDLLAGRRLTVLSAWGGTGETSPEALAELEDLAGERVPLELLDVENGLEGKTVKIQISNTGVEEGYTLHQIGVFAQVDGGPEQLLCVYQDRDQRGRKGGIVRQFISFYAYSGKGGESVGNHQHKGAQCQAVPFPDLLKAFYPRDAGRVGQVLRAPDSELGQAGHGRTRLVPVRFGGGIPGGRGRAACIRSAAGDEGMTLCGTKGPVLPKRRPGPFCFFIMPAGMCLGGV